jgi:hypothetical protein
MENREVIRHAVYACGYIALNFNFVNSDLSLEVTKALTPLLDYDFNFEAKIRAVPKHHSFRMSKKQLTSNET